MFRIEKIPLDFHGVTPDELFNFIVLARLFLLFFTLVTLTFLSNSGAGTSLFDFKHHVAFESELGPVHHVIGTSAFVQQRFG